MYRYNCAGKRKGIAISEVVKEVDQDGGVQLARMTDKPKAAVSFL
jgi:hypothetical protein